MPKHKKEAARSPPTSRKSPTSRRSSTPFPFTLPATRNSSTTPAYSWRIPRRSGTSSKTRRSTRRAPFLPTGRWRFPGSGGRPPSAREACASSWATTARKPSRRNRRQRSGASTRKPVSRRSIFPWRPTATQSASRPLTTYSCGPSSRIGCGWPSSSSAWRETTTRTSRCAGDPSGPARRIPNRPCAGTDTWWTSTWCRPFCRSGPSLPATSPTGCTAANTLPCRSTRTFGSSESGTRT
mmetsp:Transcript_473/g.992  ORF Transcript_473/g.992 Transcript_473/m.992 type:complete len:239 (+) Transcript_473:613-1329(+)